jgi:MFS family permease
VADYFGDYRSALWAAVLLCLVSLACNVVFVVMDRHAEKVLAAGDGGESDRIVLADIRQFSLSYWYVTLICLAFYSAIFPFTALSTNLFADKWGIPDVQPGAGSFLYRVFYNFGHMLDTAPGITSIVIFASMVCAPFAGQLVDKWGRRATLMVVGSLIMVPGHLALGLTRVYPAWPMIALGAAFVLVPAAMWPSIPLIVPKDKVGTAFGLTTMIQNVGLALFPFLNGKLRELTSSYTASMVMFAGLGLAGLVFAVLLKRADAREGGVLERSTT